MRELFADVPEACDNTLEIVKRIDIKIPEKIFYLPDYPVPKTPAEDVARVLAASAAPPTRARGSLSPSAVDERRARVLTAEIDPDRQIEMSADDYLRLVCEQGLIERYGAERAKNDTALRERLEYELGRHRQDGLLVVLPDRVGLHQVRARPRHPGRARAAARRSVPSCRTA